MNDVRYRCSICGQLCRPGETTAHTERHRAQPDWPGTLHWTRIDPRADRRPAAAR